MELTSSSAATFGESLARPAGRFITLTGALAGRHTGTVLPVVTGAVKLLLPNGRKFCIIAHEMIHDSNPHQHESLLPPAQVRNAGHAVDECPSDKLTPRGEYGTQCCVVDGETLPLTFDGLKCYYQLEAISDEELLTLPRVVFTNPEEYEPAKRTTTRRMNTDDVDWKRTLAFPPDDVIKATLEATTQLIPVVEAESREIMCDHLKTRLKCLRYRRRQDMDYLDTFKAKIKSV